MSSMVLDWVCWFETMLVRYIVLLFTALEAASCVLQADLVDQKNISTNDARTRTHLVR